MRVIPGLSGALSGLLMLSRRELAILVLIFATSLPAVTARLYSSDEVQYFSYLRSLWFDHDVSFENEYQYFYDHDIAQSAGFHYTLLELDTPTGRRINYGTIGCAILWSPFYAAADVVARMLRAAGRDVAVDGYSRLYVSAVAYGSAFYAFATILLSIAAARRVVGTHALSSGLAVWGGTPLLFYMYVAPPFSHACSAFAVALFVTVWLHVRRTWSVRGAIALGLSGALMAMVREQDVFFIAGPVLDFALACVFPLVKGQAVRDKGRLALVAAAGCAAFAAGYLPQLLAYNALNGRPGPSVLVARKMSWSAPHALQVLASPEHGFFFWTPLAALCVAGLIILTVGEQARPRPEEPVRLKPDTTGETVRLKPNTTGNDGSPTSVVSGSSRTPEDGGTMPVVSGFSRTPKDGGTMPVSGFSRGPRRAFCARWGGSRTLDIDGRRIGACMLLMVALQVYVSGAVESWTVAGAFGQRRFVATTILLVVGLAALQDAVRARGARIVLGTAIALCVWWNIALMAEFGTSMMDRQRLELRRNAYDAFVTLPRTAPSLVYRYFAQRASFYATDKHR